MLQAGLTVLPVTSEMIRMRERSELVLVWGITKIPLLLGACVAAGCRFAQALCPSGGVCEGKLPTALHKEADAKLSSHHHVTLMHWT